MEGSLTISLMEKDPETGDLKINMSVVGQLTVPDMVKMMNYMVQELVSTQSNQMAVMSAKLVALQGEMKAKKAKKAKEGKEASQPENKEGGNSEVPTEGGEP